MAAGFTVKGTLTFCVGTAPLMVTTKVATPPLSAMFTCSPPLRAMLMLALSSSVMPVPAAFSAATVEMAGVSPPPPLALSSSTLKTSRPSSSSSFTAVMVIWPLFAGLARVKVPLVAVASIPVGAVMS